MEFYTERLFDADQIKTFLTEAELWERISDDGNNKEEFDPIFGAGIHWIGLFKSKRLFGIIFLHHENTISATVHINIQHGDRFNLSRIAAFLGYEYILKNTEFLKINTTVTKQFPNVIKYIESLGFIFEGIKRKSMKKNNKLVDQFQYGITRDEIIDFLERNK